MNRYFWFIAILCLGAPLIACAADWPMYRCDVGRTGVTAEALALPLREAWVHKPVHAPAPAWPDPAKQDFWNTVKSIGSTSTYDHVYHVAIAGKSLYYGSSADDSIYCVDAATGKLRWLFQAEGPVRLAPAVSNGKVYAASDDGCVYCLDGERGELLWKFRAGLEDRRLPGNERIISLWPVRCGLIVDNGIVNFSAGLFPAQGVYLYALDAKNGVEKWKKEIDVPAQGYLLASDTRLFFPTGRTAPVAFDRSTGKQLGGFGGAGGDFALVLNDMLINGGTEAGDLHVDDPDAINDLAHTPGLRMTATKSMAYVLRADKLLALDRTQYIELNRQRQAVAHEPKSADQDLRLVKLDAQIKQCQKWSVICAAPCELIMAGETLIAGGENHVFAFSAADGKQLWTASVHGRAYGLAVSGGKLFVSTDSGDIHCFEPGSGQGKGAEVSALPKAAAVSPYPAEERALFEQAATEIIKRSGIKKGYCVVLGAGTGQLAYELAKCSDLQIIGVEEDGEKIATARRLLSSCGLYGSRISIHSGSAAKLPYQSLFANLVVSEETLRSGKLPATPAELFRIARPCGGTIVLGVPAAAGSQLKEWGDVALPEWTVKQNGAIAWGISRRGKLDGEGEWTHFYADPGNSACSGDTLRFGATDLQWFGKPGPRAMVDRHHRNVAPLYKDGRIFVSGDNYVVAVDAYNGTILWEHDIPNSSRLIALKDCGNMVATSEYLYVAADKNCLGFDAQSGEQKLKFNIPSSPDGTARDWGYLAAVGDVLFGSATKPGASRRIQSRELVLTVTHYDLTPMVCSDYLFALDRKQGSPRWTYLPQAGVIVNPSIAAGGGRIYFVESADPATRKVTDGRIKLPALLSGGSNLTALDQKSGAVLWKIKADLKDIQNIIHVSYSKEILLVSGSENIQAEKNGKKIGEPCYVIRAFNAATGEQLWRTDMTIDTEINGSHGEQDQHPAIAGDIIYTARLAFDLKTGKEVPNWKWNRGGHGCGTISTSASCMFNRGGNPQMIDLLSGKQSLINNVSRPGCWINIIPAGGMIMIPEASSGCTCAFSIQTSMVLAPKIRP